MLKGGTPPKRKRRAMEGAPFGDRLVGGTGRLTSYTPDPA